MVWNDMEGSGAALSRYGISVVIANCEQDGGGVVLKGYKHQKRTVHSPGHTFHMAKCMILGTPGSKFCTHIAYEFPETGRSLMKGARLHALVWFGKKPDPETDKYSAVLEEDEPATHEFEIDCTAAKDGTGIQRVLFHKREFTPEGNAHGLPYDHKRAKKFSGSR
ncbi:hypothetical protein RhiLY_05561 [Ceratobasidium sp. AG-Ba]|nr:hypothetical protein RhiLY_05561 [Ceratobasidium sp. AG-Ba]